MVDYYLERMRVAGYDQIQVLLGPMYVAIKRCDVRAVRDVIANVRFALALMETLCYKIEQEQAEEVM